MLQDYIEAITLPHMYTKISIATINLETLSSCHLQTHVLNVVTMKH